jgi:hypothetical protein
MKYGRYSVFIEQVLQVDRAGSAILEFIIGEHAQAIPGIPSINLI